MRLFIAIDLPKTIITYIELVQKRLAAYDLFKGRFVKPEYLHLTMQFLGECTQAQYEQISALLSTIIFKPFNLCLNSIGYLPNMHEIRILYIGAESKELTQLAYTISKTLRILIEPEQRDFKGHITIVRVKEVVDRKKLLHIVNTLSIEKQCFMVNEFSLKQSTLASDGPEYKILATYALKT